MVGHRYFTRPVLLIEQMPGTKPTVKQKLAAIRMRRYLRLVREQPPSQTSGSNPDITEVVEHNGLQF
jgi:hypothetical protein